MLNFQGLIQKLTAFWESKGCLIHFGHDLETGAGTFNPATFLRALGPEPYSAAYVEPSRRPADARFGQNPNRLQLFHQFQVILKPSPQDVQKMYLDSLEAIGLKLKDHDIRFVHDDWESPTLGAFGLGWEVWCDGMEVSQFTYFQAVGSLPLHPISAEITYGLERLSMFLQNVDSIFDIQWNDHCTLGDISKNCEIEWSQYNLIESSTPLHLRHFEDYEQEARRLITLHLPLPAYDFVIKASHAFNLLDARGVISTTERTGYIGRIRDLARLVATEYVASRERLGFPLAARSFADASEAKSSTPTPPFDPSVKEAFLLEIGSEELPATFIPIGSKSLKRSLEALLKEHNLPFDGIEVFGTPRRLTALIKNLAQGSSSKKLDKKGPPVSSALTPEGAWTPTGLGFLKSIGLEPAPLPQLTSLETRLIKEIPYLFATLEEPAKSTFSLLREALPTLIQELDFPKKMRWGSLNASYARPIHWIVALLGNEVVPFTFAGIASDRFTFGHAQRLPQKIQLARPEEYQEALEAHFVLVSPEARRSSIEKQLARIEAETGCHALAKEAVLDEVTYLCEWPELKEAQFDPNYLKAPEEILISEMVEHQRYFPLKKGNELANLFVITADNTPNELIREGNERVLSARLSDGVFLYEQDSKEPLEAFNEQLKSVIFQKELGSLWDKVRRIEGVTQILQTFLPPSPHAQRAAHLCKVDLVSSAVKEFPHLQGTMGKYYALAHGEPQEVAAAIEEHWLPKKEGGELPQTAAGTIVSLADKLDNLLGYFSVGLKPTSSSDPYALRRQTLGLLRILIEKKLSLNLKEVLEKCASLYTSSPITEILQFITQRAKGLFEDLGLRKDEIEASLSSLALDPYDQYRKVEALHAFRKTAAFAPLFEVYKRAKGQIAAAAAPPAPINPIEKAEHELVKKLQGLEADFHQALESKEYAKAYNLLAELQPHLAHLFESVKILVEDPALQGSRVALLQKVFSLFSKLLDFGVLQDLAR